MCDCCCRNDATRQLCNRALENALRAYSWLNGKVLQTALTRLAAECDAPKPVDSGAAESEAFVVAPACCTILRQQLMRQLYDWRDIVKLMVTLATSSRLVNAVLPQSMTARSGCGVGKVCDRAVFAPLRPM